MCNIKYKLMGREASSWDNKYFFSEVGRGGNPDSAFMLLLASRRGRAGVGPSALGAELFARLVKHYGLSHLIDDPRTTVRKLVDMVGAEAAAARAARTELAAGFVHVKGDRAVAGSVGRLRAGLADRDTLVASSPLPAGARKVEGLGQVPLDLGYTVEGDLREMPVFFIAPSSATAMGEEPLHRFLWEFAWGRPAWGEGPPAGWGRLPCLVGASPAAVAEPALQRHRRRFSRAGASPGTAELPGEKIRPAPDAGASSSRGRTRVHILGGIGARAVRSALLVGVVAVAVFFAIKLSQSSSSRSGPPQGDVGAAPAAETGPSTRAAAVSEEAGGRVVDSGAAQGAAAETPGERGKRQPPAAVELRPLWRVDLGGILTSSPADLGETVVFGSRDGHVYCLSKADGKVVWRFDGPDGFGSSPAASGGRVFIGCYDGGVYCLRADDGSRIWRYGTGGRVVSSPALTGNGHVVVGSYDGHLYCLTTDGRLRWRYNCGARVWSSPACSGGVVVFGDVAGRIHCLDASTGREIWSAGAGGAIYGSPVTDRGRAYFGSSDGALAALSIADGRVLWRGSGPAAVSSSIGIVSGDLVVGFDNGALSRISSDDGARLWTAELPGPVRSRPIDWNGVITVTCYDGRVYGIDAATGSVLSRSDARGKIYCTPLVSSDAAYFGDMKGNFAALGLITSASR